LKSIDLDVHLETHALIEFAC